MAHGWWAPWTLAKAGSTARMCNHSTPRARWQNPRPASLAQPRWASRNNICCPLISAYALGHALTHMYIHIRMHICTHIADKYFVLLTLSSHTFLLYLIIKYASMYLFRIIIFYDFFQPDLSPASPKRSQWDSEKLPSFILIMKLFHLRQCRHCNRDVLHWIMSSWGLWCASVGEFHVELSIS